MVIELNKETGYVVIMLVLMGLQIYQQLKINRLFQEATDLWEQISVLTMTVANKFTEIDTKAKELKERVDIKDKK